MKASLLLALMLLCCSSAGYARPKHRTKANDSTTVVKSYGKFNYTYLRLATFFPSAGFGNPMVSGFAGSQGFALRDDLPNRYRLAFESGKARHFMKLKLGTPTLKLAINSGIAVQAFGQGNTTQDRSAAKTDGFYLGKLALGPQLTYKPIPELRVGLYYRAGIALFYSSYQNAQRAVIGPDRVRVDRADVTFVNYAYNGDLGLDLSYRAISIGVSLQMLKLRPSKGSLFSRSGPTDEVNAFTTSIEQSGVQEGDKVITPIDPVVSFNRICVSVGFAL